ncbi:MAG: hypothetical protein JXR73_04835 [Candidatus Omnitrophica bacterium]|nr:hypothetical protein [Candidatus Omnitrophota bacterium]
MSNVKRMFVCFICVYFFILHINHAYSQNAVYQGGIKIGLDLIPINELKGLLITGLDVNEIVKKYIPEYNNLTKHVHMVAESGITHSWILLPERTKSISIDVGIFSSHRDALVGAQSYFNSIAPVVKLRSLDDKHPGFVSWIIPLSDSCPFVYNNVFVVIQVTDHYDRDAFVKQFIQELSDNGEGVFIGEKVEPPYIDGINIANSLETWTNKRIEIPVSITDPNGRNVYSSAYLTNLNYVKPKADTTELPPDIPFVRFKQKNLLEFRFEDEIDTDAELKIIAVNDRSVVSAWKKKIHINTFQTK